MQFKLSQFLTDFGRKAHLAVILLTTTLFDYLFLAVPGLDPGILVSYGGDDIHYTTATDKSIVFLVSLICGYSCTFNKAEVRIHLSPPLIGNKEDPHSHKYCSHAHLLYQSQAQAQAQVSDYICVPEFDLNIFSPHMGQLIFLWLTP